MVTLVTKTNKYPPVLSLPLINSLYVGSVVPKLDYLHAAFWNKSTFSYQLSPRIAIF